MTITELVFATATDAVFTYDLSTPVAEFPGQIGRARFLDGTWKITRATLCQDLSKAGASARRDAPDRRDIDPAGHLRTARSVRRGPMRRQHSDDGDDLAGPSW